MWRATFARWRLFSSYTRRVSQSETGLTKWRSRSTTGRVHITSLRLRTVEFPPATTAHQCPESHAPQTGSTQQWHKFALCCAPTSVARGCVMCAFPWPLPGESSVASICFCRQPSNAVCNNQDCLRAHLDRGCAMSLWVKFAETLVCGLQHCACGCFLRTAQIIAGTWTASCDRRR